MKLADRRGCSPDFLKSTMPIVEFREWVAYYQIDNDRVTVSENLLAHIACLVTNYLCKKKHSISDFLPSLKGDKKKFNKKQGEDFFKSLAGIVKKGIGIKNG